MSSIQRHHLVHPQAFKVGGVEFFPLRALRTAGHLRFDHMEDFGEATLRFRFLLKRPDGLVIKLSRALRMLVLRVVRFVLPANLSALNI